MDFDSLFRDAYGLSVGIMVMTQPGETIVNEAHLSSLMSRFETVLQQLEACTTESDRTDLSGLQRFLTKARVQIDRNKKFQALARADAAALPGAIAACEALPGEMHENEKKLLRLAQRKKV